MKLPVKGTGELKEVDEFDVVVGNEIVGRDPDPSIREQLKREAELGLD